METAFGEVTARIFLVVGALFPIVNPLGGAPIFLTLTHGVSESGRTKLARSIAINSLVLMVVSIFIGTHILGFFGDFVAGGTGGRRIGGGFDGVGAAAAV